MALGCVLWLCQFVQLTPVSLRNPTEFLFLGDVLQLPLGILCVVACWRAAGRSGNLGRVFWKVGVLSFSIWVVSQTLLVTARFWSTPTANHPIIDILFISGNIPLAITFLLDPDHRERRFDRLHVLDLLQILTFWLAVYLCFTGGARESLYQRGLTYDWVLVLAFAIRAVFTDSRVARHLFGRMAVYLVAAAIGDAAALYPPGSLISDQWLDVLWSLLLYCALVVAVTWNEEPLRRKQVCASPPGSKQVEELFPVLYPLLIAILCSWIATAHPQLSSSILLFSFACFGGRLQITQYRLRKSEKHLRDAKNAAESASLAKSEFLANMSHELRTPMNGVIGMSIVLSEMDLPAEAKEFAGIIRASGEVLLSVIKDILDFSKIESGKLELEDLPFRLDRCVEDALDIFASKAFEKKLDLAYVIDDDVPLDVLGDATRLRQILMNLVGNALKFTKAGEVVVSVSAKPLDDGRFEFHFSIRDTGIGIPSERLNRLFQSFSQVDSSTTREYGGTGLGLAISRSLCELMKGRIWVETEEGVGSTFQFTVVCGVSAKDSGRDQTCAAAPSILKDKRVLIVDDNATNRFILIKQLQRLGALVFEAECGTAALEMLASIGRFHLAILDMHMPAMDGVTLARRIKSLPEWRSLPLLLLSSASAGLEEAERGLFNATLSKPIKPEHLASAVAAAMGVRELSKSVAKSEFDGKLAERLPLRILVAEDNPVNQLLALRLLERMGYKADLAANGLEAIDALRRASYDVVLMDVQMPQMDGLEATRRIRKEWPFAGPRIIAMTANAAEGDREKCIEAGMDDYVSKPIQVASLQVALARSTPAAGESNFTAETSRLGRAVTAPIETQEVDSAV
jgi:signal transduction histidine kinase/DNA-binding response OmpR family regulator